MSTKDAPFSNAVVTKSTDRIIKLQRKEEEVTIPITIPRHLRGPLERYSEKKDITMAEAFMMYSMGGLKLELVEANQSLILHPRQREIIGILDEAGWFASNREIAEKMSPSEKTGEKITVRTVKHHMTELYKKFNVNNKKGLFKKLKDNPDLLRTAVLERTESKDSSVA